MKTLIPKYLEPYADEEHIARVMAIPQTHFYGLTLIEQEGSKIFRGRYSPTAERPVLINLDESDKKFFCSCVDFQRKVGYPVRLGLQLCDHLIRVLTMMDESTCFAMGIPEGWTCRKTDPDFERNEILAMTDYHFENGDTLSALIEIFFGVQGSLLRDMDVASQLDRISVDSVATEDLPEAMRFVSAVLQRGFSRRARTLAAGWIERFAQNIDSFAPFADVAPVALWLIRWSGTPDILFAEIRDLVIKALNRAKDQGTQGASWWLLYRSVSRAGAAPPENCINAWKEAVGNMRLALMHYTRIDDASKLLGSFGIDIPKPDENYIRMHTESVKRAHERRMHFLLRLVKARHMEPFIDLSINPYLADRYVGIEVHRSTDALEDLILSAIGYKGATLPSEQVVENWPIIQRCCKNPPQIEGALQDRIAKLWPEKTTALVSIESGKKNSHEKIAVSENAWVARWALGSPGLIANSPVVAHQSNRIYIPARGGSTWPEMFGLTICDHPAAVGRRLFTLQITGKIEAEQAVEQIKKGAHWIGPDNDPVVLLSLNLDSLSVEKLFSLAAALKIEYARLKEAFWYPERTWLGQQIEPRIMQVQVWIKKKLYESLKEGNDPPAHFDFGILFNPKLSLILDEATQKQIVNAASRSATRAKWLKKTADLLIKRLPSIDSGENPIDLTALTESPLKAAVPAIVAERKRELSKIDFLPKSGFYDLDPLKKTVWGNVLLTRLNLSDHKRLRKSEAAELLRLLSTLHIGTEGLPLFAPKAKN